ncbi:hypothetical protein [Staphylococcus debuckii]|uniref:hypothetical protein n=1 Tax=Staphylococcus debuckii TaxID=2044912 RepID=UPI000F43370A|nr:hypothetical protein [Staphylococcus debuckii]AYU56277.1 hypothetical protein CNQ82_12865 [Staphylococcus debuckii]
MNSTIFSIVFIAFICTLLDQGFKTISKRTTVICGVLVIVSCINVFVPNVVLKILVAIGLISYFWATWSDRKLLTPQPTVWRFVFMAIVYLVLIVLLFAK